FKSENKAGERWSSASRLCNGNGGSKRSARYAAKKGSQPAPENQENGAESPVRTWRIASHSPEQMGCHDGLRLVCALHGRLRTRYSPPVAGRTRGLSSSARSLLCNRRGTP